MISAAGLMSRMRLEEMSGEVIEWDGVHGIIETGAGVHVSFFPIHLVASGYKDRVKVGDRIYFRCNVVETRSYCLETIRAVAVA